MPSSEQSQSHRELIAGVPCDFLNVDDYKQRIATAISPPHVRGILPAGQAGGRGSSNTSFTHIITLNAEMVVTAQTNSEFKKAIHRAELVIPDSSGILWAREYISPPHMRGSGRGSAVHIIASLLHFSSSKTKPLTGVDSIFLICEELEKKNGTAYLLGGEERDRKITAKILGGKYPALTTIPLNDNAPLTPSLSQNGRGEQRPSAIFVALGAPKQTLWIEAHRTELKRAGIRIAIGIGGAFAMISGRLPRAPRWMRTAHLEWLWRLILEPTRIKRIWNAVVVFPRIISGYPH